MNMSSYLILHNLFTVLHFIHSQVFIDEHNLYCIMRVRSDPCLQLISTLSFCWQNLHPGIHIVLMSSDAHNVVSKIRKQNTVNQTW